MRSHAANLRPARSGAGASSPGQHQLDDADDERLVKHFAGHQGAQVQGADQRLDDQIGRDAGGQLAARAAALRTTCATRSKRARQ